METNSSNDLTYILQIHYKDQNYLGQMRHWNNLKISFADEFYWVKDFSLSQINSIEVQSIPFKMIYTLCDNKLFLLDSLLPTRKMPSVLWSPIEKVLKIELPKRNHNYFGITQKVPINIIPSINEREVFALETTLYLLEQYLDKASNIRSKDLKWVILEPDKALIIGTPILPIQGNTFWKKDNFLIPSGYDLDLHILFDEIRKILKDESEDWIVWSRNSSIFHISRELLKPLSISSLRLSRNFTQKH
ncbi:MAG: hypothetical protein ACK481_02610 [Candidatus Melainabacteria bacterium]|jgi:hypothetical protein